MSHNGYIYQACNFLYTGTTSNTKQLIDKNGNEFHFRNIGHIQNKLKGSVEVKHRKRRINEENLNKKDIAKFLKDNKGNYSASELDKIFGYKDTAAHWFRLDKGFSFPTVDDWIRLKEILKFDNSFDGDMTSFEWFPDRQEIINQLELRQVIVKPKHRYLFIKGKDKKTILNNLRYKIQPFPKGQNTRYDASYSPTVQGILF